MKKLWFFLLISVLLLSGCGKKEQLVASAELFEVTDGTTSDGVAVGDGKK